MDALDPRGAPGRDPAEGLTDEERARASARLVQRLLVGGIAFLAVVVLGMLPAALSKESPSLARLASTGAWVLAPAIGIAVLVFAALRPRR